MLEDEFMTQFVPQMTKLDYVLNELGVQKNQNPKFVAVKMLFALIHLSTHYGTRTIPPLHKSKELFENPVFMQSINPFGNIHFPGLLEKYCADNTARDEINGLYNEYIVPKLNK